MLIQNYSFFISHGKTWLIGYTQVVYFTTTSDLYGGTFILRTDVTNANISEYIRIWIEEMFALFNHLNGLLLFSFVCPLFQKSPSYFLCI